MTPQILEQIKTKQKQIEQATEQSDADYREKNQHLTYSLAAVWPK